MTTVCFFEEKDGNVIAVETKGHSGYAPEGEDVLCAFISSAMQLCGVALQETLSIPNSFFSDTEGVTMSCSIRQCEDVQQREKAYVVLNSLRLFFTQLSQQYGEYIKVEFRR